VAQKFTVPITVKQLTSAGSDALTVYVDADTFARLKVEAGGRLVWGSGSANGDVTLYRESADVLITDDSFKVGGLLTVTASSGDEGGEINLAKPATNSTISGNVAIDIYQNKIRIFETGGSNRGAYIDLTAANTGVGSNLLTGGGGGATTLDGLTDVTAPSPSNGDLIQWNGTAWVNVASSTVGATNLDGLSDVVITSPAQYQTLSYDGTTWVNDFPTTVSLVQNAEATTLQVGEAVYLFGGTGSHASVKRAGNGSDATSAKTVGLVGKAIAAGATGPVVTRGYVFGMDLSTGYTVGQTLYLGTNGGLTTTKPYAPSHLVYIGVVVRATNNGIIYVAAQNGYELDEIHDVDLITTAPTSGDFLKYNGTLWVNDKIDLGTDTNGNYMSGVSAGTGISVTHTPGEGSTATIAVDNTVVRTSDTGTVTSTMIADGTIVNADVNSAAAIAHSKLANATAGQVLLGTTTTGVITATTVSGDVTITGAGVTAIGSGVIVNADINASAAIDKTKISGTAITAADTGTVTSTMIADGTIVNADINASAAIALSKLASGTSGQIIVANASGVPTWVSESGDISISDTGVTAISSGVIVDADINSAAAIALSKLSTTGAASGYVISYNGTSWAASQLSNNSYNLDGGTASSTYGGITSLNGGSA
jgi:hypothetical protein